MEQPILEPDQILQECSAAAVNILTQHLFAIPGKNETNTMMTTSTLARGTQADSLSVSPTVNLHEN